jgi:hypothetical protein
MEITSIAPSSLKEAVMHRAFAFGFTLALALPALAGAPSNRLTIEDVFNLELATDPQISPDGKRVV